MTASLRTLPSLTLSCVLCFFTPVAMSTMSSLQNTAAKKEENAFVSPLYIIKADYAVLQNNGDHYQMTIPSKHISTISQVSDRPQHLTDTIEPNTFVALIKQRKAPKSHTLASMHLAWETPLTQKGQKQAFFKVTAMTYKHSTIYLELKQSGTTRKPLPNQSGSVAIYLVP